MAAFERSAVLLVIPADPDEVLFVEREVLEGDPAAPAFDRDRSALPHDSLARKAGAMFRQVQRGVAIVTHSDEQDASIQIVNAGERGAFAKTKVELVRGDDPGSVQ